LKYYTKEALDNGLRIDILAPSPNAPSMTMALEKYILEANKGKNY
jgi:uroporphyrinogen-III synthase